MSGRLARVGLLAAVPAGWLLLVVGVVGDLRFVVIVGASLLAIAATLVAKLAFELRTDLAKARREALALVEDCVARIERSDQRARDDSCQLTVQAGLLSDEVIRLSGEPLAIR